MSDAEINVNIAAYERGILPRKVSQLENDLNYADKQWVEKNFLKKGTAGFTINCGNVEDRFKEM